MSNLLVTTIQDKDGGSTITVPTSGTFTLGAGWIWLETLTASASATLDSEVTAGYDGTYKDVVYTLTDIMPATDGTDIWIRVKDSTYQADAADYEYGVHGQASSGAFNNATSQGAAQILLNCGDNVGSEADEGISGIVRLSSPDNATRPAGFQWEMLWWDDQATPVLFKDNGGGAYNGSFNAITGVRFMMSSGNITSGTIQVYGVQS